MKAQWEVDQGMNADDSLNQAKNWNQRASTLDDLLSSSWTSASILSIEAKQMMFKGESALPTINQSLELFGHMLKAETEYQPHIISDMLYVLALQALELTRLNQDPIESIQRAQNLFDQTMQTPHLLATEQWALINNMAQVHWVAINHQFDQGEDIVAQGNQLIALLSPDDYLLKDDPLQLISLANTHLLMAEYLRRHQQPINNHLDLAKNYISEAKKINPNNYSTLISQGTLLTIQSFMLEQNFTAANTTFEQAIAINGSNPYNHQAWAKSLLLQAQSNLPAEQRRQALESGLSKINTALSIDGEHPSFNNTKQELLNLSTNVSPSSN